MRPALVAAVGAACILQPVVLPGAAASAPPDLSWLTGTWCGESRGSRFVESWTDADGALMLAVNREVRADGRVAFEFLRIELAGAPPAYVSQPGGAPPTRFTLVESGATHVVFANPAHDFPKRIGYRRDGAGLLAWIDDGTDRGRRSEWRWRACAGASR